MRTLFLSLALALISQDIDAPRISQEDFKKLFTSHNLIIVDTRNESNFAAGHIPGAIKLPLEGQMTWPPEYEKTVSMLLAARDEDGAAMPDRQVRDEVLTLMLAGHETTANALAWSWLLLDRHPGAAGRLHAEVDPLPGAPGYDDLDRLPWTRAVVAETMRLYPPAWVIGRRMLADVTLDGWTIPARSICMACQWVTHRDARWWTEPLAFRPERWMTADGRYDEAAPGQPRGAYFPFGMGRRVCIGESFAWTEAVLVLGALARDWAPTLRSGHPVDVRPAITLRPAHGLPMALRRRRASEHRSEARSGASPEPSDEALRRRRASEPWDATQLQSRAVR